MKLQELLAGKEINLERTKLIRHNLTNEVVAENYAHGFWSFTSLSNPPPASRTATRSSVSWGQRGQMVSFRGVIK